MSRLIVKGLPKRATVTLVRELFEHLGVVTDVQLKYTEGGIFRRFAFLGFESSESAAEAVKQLNETYCGASCISVALANDLSEKSGDVAARPDSAAPGKKQRKEAKLPAHGVLLKGIPPSTKKQQVEQFFHGLNIVSVNMPSNKAARSRGEVTVEFAAASDVEPALRRNKSFVSGKRVIVTRLAVREEKTASLLPLSVIKKMKAAKEGPEDVEGEAAGTIEDTIADTGRLYLRNLAYTCKEEDLEGVFSPFGLLTEVHLPLDKLTKRNKGFAFVSFMMPEHAIKALNQLDGTVLQGRMLHILSGQPKQELEIDVDNLPFKQKQEHLQKKAASLAHNWNTLFLGQNAVAEAMAAKYGTSKSDVLDVETGESLAVRMALGETELVLETRGFLEENGVLLDAFSLPATKRSKTCFLVKNLPAGTTRLEVVNLCQKHGSLLRLVLPPRGVTALVEFQEPQEARAAFKALAYSKFKYVPLFLEWAPSETFSPDAPTVADVAEKEERKRKEEAQKETEKVEDEDVPLEGTTLFVKNLNFKTEESRLAEFFTPAGPVHEATIARQRRGGAMLSCGYGFVTFTTAEGAQKALKTLQHSSLDDHKLELKVSHRVRQETTGERKTVDVTKAPSTKIMVRNVPFEAAEKEIRELFAVFGEVRSCRLPLKISAASSGRHRGFGFVDMSTKADAKRAFNSLCHSTHLYGRRLVLEWAASEEDATAAGVAELRKRAAVSATGDSRQRVKKAAIMSSVEGRGPVQE